MCTGCLHTRFDLDDRTIQDIRQRPAVVELMGAIARFYEDPECSVGGPLHVQLDDTNVGDEYMHLDAGMRTYYEDRRDLLDAAEAILGMMIPLTVAERAVATVMWTPPTKCRGGQDAR